MELRLASQTFYWNEIVNNLNNNDNIYNPLEWKYVKGGQDIPMHQNRKT